MADNDQRSSRTSAKKKRSARKQRSGGVNLKAKRVRVAGDVVGRDKIVQNITQEAPAPIATSLHQLPPPPRDFTDREVELAELMAKAEADGVTISALQGMGGVGKTALALVLAERLKPRYPDAQFYLDLKGAHEQKEKPLSVAEALAHVIRAYHPTSELPESEADLRGLYLSVLNDRRALLLMDNAIDKTQVESLIPPSACFLVVTSRQQFTLPGLFAKDLAILPPQEARDLLCKIAPRSSGQADAIAKLCGYLPLALRLAGSALAERRTLTPEDYVKRLTDAQTRLELVEASLSLSYDLLNEDLQRAWRALAVFLDTFDLAAVAAVWGVEDNLAQDQLDELVHYSLVDWNETTSRARLHDLARLFAHKLLGDAERMDCARRHAAHYQQVAAAAENMYQQGSEGLMQGLALFDLEWANIQTGHAWAEQYKDIDAQALSLCDDYPTQSSQILTLRQRPSERIAWLETALLAARKLARTETEGAHLISLGAAYQAVGKYDTALRYLEQRLNMEREADTTARTEEERAASLAGRGQVLANLGIVYKHLSEYRRAIDYSQQALDIFQMIEATARSEEERLLARRGEVGALNMIGASHQHLGEYNDAINYCGQALNLAEKINEQRGQGSARNNLGIAYQHLGETRRAIENSERALEVFEKLGDQPGKVQAWTNLGDAYRSLHEIGRAIEFYGRASSMAGEIDDPLGEANALHSLAICYEANHARPQAVAYAQAALDKFTVIKSPDAQSVRDLLAKWRA